MRAGQTENISFALLRGQRPASSTVTVTLLKDDAVVAQAARWTAGHGVVPLAVPRGGRATTRCASAARVSTTRPTVQVEDSALVFLETDKPIYKPGQTVHIRVLTLDPHLEPLAGEARSRCWTRTGIKIFKQPVTLDDYGMATSICRSRPSRTLASGRRQRTGRRAQQQLDLRVERYVLPKYEVAAGAAESLGAGR